MKTMLLFLLAVLILTGCETNQTFETLSDEPVVAVSAQQREVKLELPDDASVMTMSCDDRTIYLSDNYEICLEVLHTSDLDRTIRQITGFHAENLTVLKIGYDGFTRQDLVWSTVGEHGEYLGRAAVLDDGCYHYVLSVLVPVSQAQDLEEQWNQMFDSFELV